MATRRSAVVGIDAFVDARGSASASLRTSAQGPKARAMPASPSASSAVPAAIVTRRTSSSRSSPFSCQSYPKTPICTHTDPRRPKRMGQALRLAPEPIMPPQCAACADSRYGRITVSITWITPLLALMSVAVTVAPSTITLPPVTLTLASLPLTVLALLSLTTSAASTFPETT
jgi:hypothetical protein